MMLIIVLINLLSTAQGQSCSWVGKSGSELMTLATSPNKLVDTTTNKACIVTGGCPTCACPYYTKYSNDGGATWLGFTFQGTPGGTGCVSSLSQALTQLQSQINQGLCGCTDYIGCKWMQKSPSELLTLATSPNKLVDTTTNKACIVTGGCPTCACPYYTKYSNDGGATWLGFTFQGTPGGTGCVSSLAQAQTQLLNQINQGLCGCSECSWRRTTGTALLPLATTPNFIGQPSVGKRCSIFGTCSTCACPNYVKYSNNNGSTWLGYTFQATPGGTGCVYDMITGLSNLQKQISEGLCGC